uniref:Uncharacterized protein n=1 Tax=Caenorhabditis japonica TaxID=281687 RepID=A0A8R1EQ35_CAEJA
MEVSVEYEGDERVGESISEVESDESD